METGNRLEEPRPAKPQRSSRFALAAVLGLSALAVGGPILAESCAGESNRSRVEATAGPDGGKDIGDIRKETLERSGAATE